MDSTQAAIDRPSVSPRRMLERVTVLIVNYNAGPWLKRAVQSVRPDQAGEPQVLIVDNGSSDNSLGQLKPGPTLEIDRVGRNLGFAGAIQLGLERVQREFVLVLNPDCLITPQALLGLIQELDNHPEAGLVSGCVIGEDGLEQRASRRNLPTPNRIIHELWPGRSASSSEGVDLTHTPAPHHAINIEAVSGACMLVRRTALQQIGGFDTGYPLHFEDLDLFARLHQHQWTIRWCPDVHIVHIGGQSSSSRPLHVLWAKHRGLWRYLTQHCKSDWPVWQRPIWAVLLCLHASMNTPRAWLQSRRK